MTKIVEHCNYLARSLFTIDHKLLQKYKSIISTNNSKTEIENKAVPITFCADGLKIAHSKR